MPLKYKDSIVLVGGAPVAEADFDLVRKRAGICVAADGGADALLRFGVIPDAVIGDLDSLSEAGRAAIPPDRVFEISEQDSTDFEKALRHIDAPLVYALGFTGARLDHGLATLHVLSRFSDRPVLLLGEEDVTVHLPTRIVLNLDPGLRLSLFPLDAVTVGMSGLRWSFEALALHPLHKIGTSNEVIAPRVELTSDAPGVMLIVPRGALAAVEDALLRADLHSPQT